jgi:hypothetical protein
MTSPAVVQQETPTIKRWLLAERIEQVEGREAEPGLERRPAIHVGGR